MSITLPSGTVVHTQEEYEAAQVQINSLGDLNTRMLKDFNVISAALLEEALERDWCDDYDNFVDIVNDGTTTLKLNKVKNKYNVHVMVTRTLTQLVTAEVYATSENDARYDVENDISGFVNIDDSMWNEEDEYEIEYVEEI
jgi:hypothetical protein